MKPNKRAGVLLFLTAGILALGLSAAAQEKKPQFYMVEEYVVKPSMVAQLETGLKDVVATIYRPFDWPWPLETFATDDFHYYFLYPFANFAEIDTAFARFYEILAKVGSDKWFRGHTHVRLKLESGRTHQIRVHMAHIHYPLVGDRVYGGRMVLPKGATPELIEALRGFKRQALHAARLAFAHPIGGKPIECASPLPDDMRALPATLAADAAATPGRR